MAFTLQIFDNIPLPDLFQFLMTSLNYLFTELPKWSIFSNNKFLQMVKNYMALIWDTNMLCITLTGRIMEYSSGGAAVAVVSWNILQVNL